MQCLSERSSDIAVFVYDSVNNCYGGRCSSTPIRTLGDSVYPNPGHEGALVIYEDVDSTFFLNFQ